ncbi:DUF4400 domain-containing protein [Thiocystis violacea]|uniref:DUF4400 domain-containing protein n=1 Tax=Thiocystis violacea TaxID=13725 RepID=UPI00190539A5|nr:DUF4400 domain-containing protein [Thiocystis violacea]MBK1717170.1 hypothetical protein [Thiocystis violacea]
MPAPESGPARGPVGAGGLAVLLLLLVSVLVVALWVPTVWLEQVQALEPNWYRQGLGDRSAEAVLAWAQRPCSGHLGAPDPWFDRAGAVRLEGIDPAWLAERSRAIRLLAELACRRAALLAAWAPALVLLLVAGVLEGHWRWRIRQLGFDYPSPVARQASRTGLALVVGLLLLALWLPLPLHPFVIPLLTLIAVRLIGTGIAHLPKQL